MQGGELQWGPGPLPPFRRLQPCSMLSLVCGLCACVLREHCVHCVVRLVRANSCAVWLLHNVIAGAYQLLLRG